MITVFIVDIRVDTKEEVDLCNNVKQVCKPRGYQLNDRTNSSGCV